MSCCPKCKSNSIMSTLLAFKGEDNNRRTCMTCGFSWKPSEMKEHMIESRDDKMKNSKLEELKKHKELLTSQLNTIEETIKLVESQVKKSRKELDDYWYINSIGCIVDAETSKSPANSNYYRFRVGNYFETTRDAYEARDKQLLLQRYKDFIDEITEEPVDWSDHNQKKYTLCYDFQTGGGLFCVAINMFVRYQGVLNTTNENLIELAKERFTEDELKIIVGV